MNTDKTIPDGYLQNAQGHLVPVSAIRPLDQLRDQLVTDVIASVRGFRAEMQHFKKLVLGEIGTFVVLAAEQYDTQLGGKKGNLSLVSFNGRYKIMLAVSDTLVFDERLQIAKQLIDDCIHKWTQGSDDKIKALIEHAFQTDKAGNINTARVLGLFKLNINDEIWKKAMQALKDSISIASSKSYVRFYERVGEEEKYQQIALDLSSIAITEE